MPDTSIFPRQDTNHTQLAANPLLVTLDAVLTIGADGGFGSVVTLICLNWRSCRLC